MKWKAVWSHLPIQFGTVLGTVENATQFTVFKNFLNGDKVKLQLTNRFSDRDLVLERVTIGVWKPDSEEVCGAVGVTYRGDSRIRIPAGAEFYSDEISFPVRTGQELVVSMYVKDAFPARVAATYSSGRICHSFYRSGDVCSPAGGEQEDAGMVIGFRSLCVETGDDVQTIALFGDSITHMCYYSDALTEKINERFPGKYAIVNRGIGGNRLLQDPMPVEGLPEGDPAYGKAGIARFEEDVYAEEVPEIVLVLEGINDLMHPYINQKPGEVVTGGELADGLSKLIALSHEKGSKIYVGTIEPYYSRDYAVAKEGESARKYYNDWICSQSEADGVLDFAAALADEGDPMSMREGTDLGDGLHPNEAGGAIMADVAMSALFRE